MTTGASATYELQRDVDGVVLTVTLSRPRCLDIAGKQELTELFTGLIGDEDIRVVLLASADPTALLVDVSELARMTPAAALAYSRAGQRLMNALETLPIPIVAAVSGPALGGGCELVLGCDLALCTEDAVFGQIEANGGVVPAFGGTWRLARRVGYQRACQLIFTAAVIDAHTAQRYGIVLETLPPSELLTRCHEIATQISAASRTSVAEAKRILTGSWGHAPALANAMEQAGFAALFGTADQQGRMDAFLAEHDG